MSLTYTLRRAPVAPELRGEWESLAWSRAETLRVDQFHPKSKPHRPVTRAKALYDDEGLYVHFRVEDRYVRSVHTAYQSQVSGDSCVEMFVRPRPDAGYFNFEINAGGTLLLYYITDPGPSRPKGGAGMRSVEVEPAWLERVRIYHSLPAVVDPEIADPVTWSIEFFAPFALLEAYAGPVDPATPGWRANFYKCGPYAEHKHWASWSPIGRDLNFHQPDKFGSLVFEGAATPSACAAGERSGGGEISAY